MSQYFQLTLNQIIIPSTTHKNIDTCDIKLKQKQKKSKQYATPTNQKKKYSLHDQSETRSLSDSLDNIPSSVFGPEGIVTRFTLPLSYGRKEARQKRQGYAK